MSDVIDVQKNPDGSWTASGGSSLTVVRVTCLTEHKAITNLSAALHAIRNKPCAVAEPQCLLCLGKKTIPGNIPGGFVKDCPDCCGEEG